jgi:cell wall-associated NlpC family hydrolase
VSTAPLSLSALTLNGQDAGKHHADLIGAMTDLTVRQTVTGASTVDVTLADAKRTLVTSAALTSRSRIVLDGAGYTLVSVSKSGARVTLTFEDDAVAELRRHNGVRKAKPGTTTRAGFVTTLIREVPDLRVVVAPGSSKNLVELSRGSGASSGGTESKEDTWTAAGRIMGEIGWRVYAYRGTVYVAPDKWLIAHNGTPYVLSPDSKGVHDIDFQWDTGKPAATATITADAGFHDLAPGSPVTLQKMGPANGSWLVETIERSTYSKKVTVSAIRPQPVLPEPKDQAAANAAALGNLGIPVFRGDYLGDASAGSTIDNSFRLAPTGATGIGALTQVTSERFVQLAYAQRGKPYVYGAHGPNSWDCSGFVMDMAHRVGVSISAPVSNIAATCRRKGTTITVAQAAYARGAVIWRQRGGGANDHIVISLGDGEHTIEAMGRAYGVVVGKIKGRDWTGAGTIPGIPVNVPSSRDLRPG